MSDDLIKALQKEAREDAEIITRLRAELAAALAECERLNKSRNRWGKKYNDCLGKLRLAVMSDSDYVKEIDYQNTRLRAENERLREALMPFAKKSFDCGGRHILDREYVPISWLLDARAAIEDVTETPNVP